MILFFNNDWANNYQNKIEIALIEALLLIVLNSKIRMTALFA